MISIGLPGLGPLLLVLSATAATPIPPVMFRGDPAHTGVTTTPFFSGQGGVRWRVRTGGAVRSTPAVTATRLYVGSGDGMLYAIDRRAGRVVWRFEAGGAVDASPAVAGGLVLAATSQGRIFAVDQATGRLRWSVVTGAALPYHVFPAGKWDLWASSPVIVDSTVVIGAPDGGVYALDLASGRRRWRAATGGRVRATPTVHGNLVIAGSWDGRVYGLDLATGAERWVHHTVGDTLDSKQFGYDRRSVQSSAAVAGGMVFVGSRDGAIYGLDEATGERRWRVSHHGSWVIGSPAVAGERVYVGSSDGHFAQALDPGSGRELWHLNTGANVLASPLRVGELLMLATYRTDAAWGDLLAVDPTSGAVRWRMRLEEATVSSPVAADGELYLGTEAGTVLAIHQVSPTIPRLAVFYDPTLVGEPSTAGGPLAGEYFRQQGYEVLDASGLARFFRERIVDTVPSAVVMATDVLPQGVAPVLADTVLLTRYLRAGGKIVGFGVPLGAVVHDSAGRYLGQDPPGMEKLLGVPAASLDYESGPSHPTEAGRRWGLDRVVRGYFQMKPAAVGTPLALDAEGKANAWVYTYRPDRLGSGYVQLWGYGATLDRLPMIRAAAEYGLLSE
jgi:eukaryotic-like serine/threonine-protein kinase